MRLLAIADVEDLNWKHGEGEADILLSCGDVPDHVILEAADEFRLADNSICQFGWR